MKSLFTSFPFFPLERLRRPLQSARTLALLAGVFSGVTSATGAEQPYRALTPDEALKVFQIEPGLRIELVVAEPMVVDPVAFAWDEQGRLYVVENRGYPDPLQTSGEPKTTLGRVARLEDTNGDGTYDRRTEFATGLGYPNGIAVWRGGVYVSAAPDLLYLKDNDGDGIAEERRVVLTGFEDSKTAQIRFGFPTLGLDGLMYLACGRNGGKVTSPEHPGRPVVTFTQNNSRFDPDTLEFEVVGGSFQFGLEFDFFGRRFGVQNRHPVLHTVVEPRHLKRNPHLAINASDEEVSKTQHEAKVFPISNARTASYWGQRFRPNPATLMHEGTFTSACSLHFFGGTALTPDHIGNAFACEPAQNLVQRQVMRPHGATFRSDPPYKGREFLSSPDLGFRPVYLESGPDGALYIADMHRREIDHPQYVPEQARPLMDFRGPEGTGRIYRIVKDKKPLKVTPRKTVAELCRDLESSERWWRDTAFRLLIERADPAAAPLVEKLARGANLAATRAKAVWVAHALKRATPELLTTVLKDRDADVREQAIWIAEQTGEATKSLLAPLLAMARDPDPRVRFVTALVIGASTDARVVDALATIGARDGEDRWTRAAVLSGVGSRMEDFYTALGNQRSRHGKGFAAMMEDLSRVVGAGASPDSCRRFLTQMLAEDPKLTWCLPAIISLSEGLRGRSDLGAKKGANPLAALLSQGEKSPGTPSLDDLFQRAATLAQDETATTTQRTSAISLLGSADYAQVGSLLGDLLNPRHAPALQLQAVRALERLGDPRGGELLVRADNWTRYTPQVRAAVVSTMTSKPALIGVLYKAIENGPVKATDIPSLRRTQLLKHTDPKVKAGAESILQKLEGGDRMKVYQSYRDIVKQPLDAARGAEPFKRVCSACHTYNGAGGRVGPDLGGVRNQTDEALLLHILVPNHEITPGYEAVSVTTKDGRSLSGWLVSESENGLTLRTPFDTEEIVSRANIADFSSSGISLMPDGIEHMMTKEELANVVAYLKQEPAAARK